MVLGGFSDFKCFCNTGRRSLMNRTTWKKLHFLEQKFFSCPNRCFGFIFKQNIRALFFNSVDSHQFLKISLHFRHGCPRSKIPAQKVVTLARKKVHPVKTRFLTRLVAIFFLYGTSVFSFLRSIICFVAGACHQCWNDVACQSRHDSAKRKEV